MRLSHNGHNLYAHWYIHVNGHNQDSAVFTSTQLYMLLLYDDMIQIIVNWFYYGLNL